MHNSEHNNKNCRLLKQMYKKMLQLQIICRTEIITISSFVSKFESINLHTFDDYQIEFFSVFSFLHSSS